MLNHSIGYDIDDTRSSEVDSRRRYTDLILYYRPSSEGVCKGTKHVLSLTSVKLAAGESPYNDSSCIIWNSLYDNGSYLSYYRTHETSPLFRYIRPSEYLPRSMHEKTRHSRMMHGNYYLLGTNLKNRFQLCL